MNSQIVLLFFAPPPLSPTSDSSAAEADVFLDARGENVTLTERQSLFNEERWGKEEKKKEGVEGGGRHSLHCI